MESSSSTIGGIETTTMSAGENYDETTSLVAYRLDISGYTFPEANSVRFNWYLDYTQGNGLSITDFGLLGTDGTLFSRKVRSEISKDSDLSLEGTWTITFN